MDIDRVMTELLLDLGRLSRLMTQVAGPGLTRTEATLLGAVAERPRRITDLVRFVGLTQPRITTVVQSLEQQGLTLREADPADGRAVLIRVTERGRALLEERQRRISDALVASLSEQRLDADEVVAEAAAKVRVLVQALEPAPAAR